MGAEGRRKEKKPTEQAPTPQLYSTIRQIQEKVNRLENFINQYKTEYNNEIQNIKKEIDKIKSKLNELPDNIRSLFKQEISQYCKDIGKTICNYDQLAEQIKSDVESTIKSYISDLDNKIKALEKEIGRFERRLSSLEDGLSQPSDEKPLIGGSRKKYMGKKNEELINKINARLGELQEYINQQTTEIKEYVDGKIDEVQNRLSKLERLLETPKSTEITIPEGTNIRDLLIRQCALPILRRIIYGIYDNPEDTVYTSILMFNTTSPAEAYKLILNRLGFQVDLDSKTNTNMGIISLTGYVQSYIKDKNKPKPTLWESYCNEIRNILKNNKKLLETLNIQGGEQLDQLVKEIALGALAIIESEIAKIYHKVLPKMLYDRYLLSKTKTDKQTQAQ